MPGLFDGMRLSTTGIRAQRVLQEVIGQNVANASNGDYTRQEARLVSGPSLYDKGHFLGQGTDVATITRIRDELLDVQVRDASSTQARYETRLQWLQKIEAAYDEPSDLGVSANLSRFWEAWSELSNTPESFASRSGVITRTENLTTAIRDLDTQLADYREQLDQALRQEAVDINSTLDEIAQLNGDIFQLEAGRNANANDLRDQRDAALERLSSHIDISYYEASNGMMQVSVAGHPAIIMDRAEHLETQTNFNDASQLELVWEYGDRFRGAKAGVIAGLEDIRDDIIPEFRSELDTFASTLIQEVNGIYANGMAMSAEDILESRLGFEALGVSSVSEALSIVPSGGYGSIHVSFFDANEDVVRSHGIVVEPTDSLNDIALKLNGIPGLDATTVFDTNNDGRLRLRLESLDPANANGEVTIGITDNTGGFDSSGLLDLLGFSQTDKTTNTSATQPTLASRDLTELQTILGQPSLAAVQSTALGLAGRFTINGFETMTETGSKTNGNHVQQLAIEVTSSDSINSIMTKINNLTASFGISASVNGTTNKLEITSTAQTDGDGNVVLSGGTDYLRLGFANVYRYPDAVNDEPPAHWTGKGDTTGLMATLQLNTLFQGSSASDIAVNSSIQNAEQINAGYSLSTGSNQLALDIVALQHEKLTVGNQFTLGEYYENHVASVGTTVTQAERLEKSEALLLESYISEKDRISGVNLDEELARMIEFQRSYEANARLFSTFDAMVQEILQIIR